MLESHDYGGKCKYCSGDLQYFFFNKTLYQRREFYKPKHFAFGHKHILKNLSILHRRQTN